MGQLARAQWALVSQGDRLPACTPKFPGRGPSRCRPSTKKTLVTIANKLVMVGRQDGDEGLGSVVVLLQPADTDLCNLTVLCKLSFTQAQSHASPNQGYLAGGGEPCGVAFWGASSESKPRSSSATHSTRPAMQAKAASSNTRWRRSNRVWCWRDPGLVAWLGWGSDIRPGAAHGSDAHHCVCCCAVTV